MDISTVRNRVTAHRGGFRACAPGGNHLPSTGLKATWWSGSGLDTYGRDWTTKVIFHVYQRFFGGILSLNLDQTMRMMWPNISETKLPNIRR